MQLKVASEERGCAKKLLSPFSELRQVSLLQNGSEKQSSTENGHSKGTLGLINDCYLVRIMSALLLSNPQPKRRPEPDRKKKKNIRERREREITGRKKERLSEIERV